MFSKIKKFINVIKNPKEDKICFEEQIEYTRAIAKDLGILDQADKAIDPELLKLLSGKGEYLFRAGWILGYVRGNGDD